LSGHRHPDGLPQSHLHVHVHGDYVHTHRHGHDAEGHGHGETPQGWLDRHLGELTLYQALRPIAVGIVHGLAGSAAVALLVLAQIREPLWAVAYLLLFGVGTMSGMMLITSLIAVPFAASHRLPYLNLALRVVAGVLSLALGVYLAWRIGVVDGLLAGARI
jgi:high-affinity nickel-transport protein